MYIWKLLEDKFPYQNNKIISNFFTCFSMQLMLNLLVTTALTVIFIHKIELKDTQEKFYPEYICFR